MDLHQVRRVGFMSLMNNNLDTHTDLHPHSHPSRICKFTVILQVDVRVNGLTSLSIISF
jgi:hypothetical protein